MTTTRRPFARASIRWSALALAALSVCGASPIPATPAHAAMLEAPDADASRQTLARLSTPITARFEEQRLEDVLTFIQQITGTEFEIYWEDQDPGGVGLDRDAMVSLRVRNAPALTVIERVLSRTRDPFGFAGPGSATWQLTDWGELVIGPREALNRDRRVVIYPVEDLLSSIPDYPDAPMLDLQSVLQAGRGGGGQSPFRDDQTDRVELPSMEELAEDLIDIIIRTVEPEQWEDAGGNAASIRYWRGNLLVNAPDYVHRGINGYPWWPSHQTFARRVDGRRFVSLTPDTGVSVLKDLNNHPVTAPKPVTTETTNPGGG